MRRMRTSIAKVMLFIAIVGVNFAAIRALVGQGDLENAAAVAPVLIAMQVGVWAAVRGRARHRWFWLGWVAAWAVWPMLVAWILVFQEPGVVGSWLLRYLIWSQNRLAGPVRPLLSRRNNNMYTFFSACAIVHVLPQAAVACAGGLLSHWVLRPARKWLTGREKSSCPGGSIVAKSVAGESG